MECPKCGLESPESAQRCDCGYDFETGAMEQSYLTSRQQGISGKKGFDIGEVLRFGSRTTWENLGFFVLLLLLAWVVVFIPQTVARLLAEEALLLSILVSLVVMVLNAVVTMGLIKIGLKFCDNEKGNYRDLFSCFPLFFNYLFCSILQVLIVLGGLMLFIVPGIIWALQYSLSFYFIVDKEMGPVQALKASAKTTKGAKWDLFGFGLTAFGVLILGFLCLFIGLLVAVPTVMVAGALVYRTLLAQSEGA